MPAFDGGDDFVGIGGPDEGFRLPVVLGEIAIDGGLEVDDGVEDATLETPLGQLGEEALNRIEGFPRRRNRASSFGIADMVGGASSSAALATHCSKMFRSRRPKRLPTLLPRRPDRW